MPHVADKLVAFTNLILSCFVYHSCVRLLVSAVSSGLELLVHSDIYYDNSHNIYRHLIPANADFLDVESN